MRGACVRACVRGPRFLSAARTHILFRTHVAQLSRAPERGCCACVFCVRVHITTERQYYIIVTMRGCRFSNARPAVAGVGRVVAVRWEGVVARSAGDGKTRSGHDVFLLFLSQPPSTLPRPPRAQETVCVRPAAMRDAHRRRGHFPGTTFFRGATCAGSVRLHFFHSHT